MFSPRTLVKDAFHHAVKSVDAARAVSRRIGLHDSRLYIYGEGGNESFGCDLSLFKHVFLLGCGKASAHMAKSIYDILGSHISEGSVAVKDGHAFSPSIGPIIINEASHPEPDSRGEKAAMDAINIMKRADEKDLIIAVISGGGSALWPSPAEGISLPELQKTTSALLSAGADIQQTNTIRKHISRIKGGYAAAHAYPANVIVFLVSDVVGDRIDSIASGPFAPDETTFEDAWKVIDDYNLRTKLPSSVIDHLQEGLLRKIKDTPDKNSPFFDRIRHFIVADNIKAQTAAMDYVESKGVKAIRIQSPVIGDVIKAAKEYVEDIVNAAERTTGPLCVISGGETTVTLKDNHGMGGRNQQYALQTAKFLLNRFSRFTFLSCGTDGTDGPTEATGAIVDHLTFSRCREISLDPEKALKENNTYPLLKALDDLVITGPTGTNVCDIQILYLW